MFFSRRCKLGLLFLAILALAFPPSLPGPSASTVTISSGRAAQQVLPSYEPAVLPGDEATYGNVSASWASNVPPALVAVPSIIQPFLNASEIGLVVETVSGSSVTALQTLSYPNGTMRTSTIIGDVRTDGGNLTLWIVAGGLHPGDHLYASSNSQFGVPTINYTVTRVFAAVSRLLNVYNATLTLSGANVAIVACWDQATGILVSADFRLSYNGATPFGTFYAKGSGSVRLTETNLWSATPSFKLNASNLVWELKSASGKDIPITASSLGGFGGQVTIVLIVPMGIQVSGLNPSILSVPVNGSATSTLTITVPPSMAEGRYYVTVAGSKGSGPTSGPSSSVKLTINVVGDFTVSTGTSSLSVQTGSAVTIPVELYSLGLSGQAAVTVSVSLGGLKAAVANSSLALSPGTPSRTNLTVTANRGIVLGSYTVTITGTKGALLHSRVENVTVTAGPGSASTGPFSKILGLDPPVFYGILAAVAVLVIASVLGLRRRARSKAAPS
ncbi:hypothetical protein E6H29_05200 [Candidatus Bathyarchaeota archaeon]|nr:MAG: hypothetical protein E6H29_05200 [Candidatus Bathyarchaeota archaeon]